MKKTKRIYARSIKSNEEYIQDLLNMSNSKMIDCCRDIIESFTHDDDPSRKAFHLMLTNTSIIRIVHAIINMSETNKWWRDIIDSYTKR